MSETEKCIDCIKALSKLDGLTISMGGLTNREPIDKEIDTLMKYFENLLKELTK